MLVISSTVNKGIFQNRENKTLNIYIMDYGVDTNIEEKIHALEKGLRLVHSTRYNKLVVEGDSRITIEVVGNSIKG